MDVKRLVFIKNIGEDLCKAKGKVIYWQLLKEQYLKLDNDEDKNKILAMIFRDKEKEGN